jgi:hypothetical protein
VLLGTRLALVFFYAPLDADQGLSQKIFYIHVPIALTSYACFGWGRLEGASCTCASGIRSRPRELRRRSTRA